MDIAQTVFMTTKQSLHDGAADFSGPRQVRCGSLRMAGVLPVLLGSMLLGTIGVFVHRADADPLTATWFRCAFGLLGLTCWVLWRRQAGFLRLTPSTGPWVLAAGLLMVASWGLFFTALGRIPAGVAVVLFHVQPLWLLLLGALWLKEPVGRRRIAAVLAAMLGLVLATGLLEHLAVFGRIETGMPQPDYWPGVVACLAGALCTACVTLIAKRMRHMPAGVLAWWQCAAGTLALWAWPMARGWPDWGMPWAWLAGLGLIHTGLAYTLIYAGIARLATGRIAVLQFAYPAVAVVIDWLFLGQRLGGVQLMGVVLMMAAVGFAGRSGGE